MAFNKEDYIMSLKGKDYLPVPARILWFRDKYPNGKIDTDFFTVGSTVVAKASVTDNEGNFLASGSATVRAAKQSEQSWSGREIEKAETAAIGRALGHAGFGTQFDEEDMDYLADSPQAPKKSLEIDDYVPSSGNSPQVQAWTKTQQKAFWDKWHKVQAIAKETILEALGVSGLSEWQGTAKDADNAMNEYIERMK